MAKGASIGRGRFHIGSEPRDIRECTHSSTSGVDELHGSMQDVRVLERSSSEKIMLDDLVIVREDQNTYKEAEASPREISGFELGHISCNLSRRN